MTCEIVKDLIPMYVDETASEETMEAVKKHIVSCPDCRKFYNSCKDCESKMSGKPCLFVPLKDKVLDASKLDEKYANLSKKIKSRKNRHIAISVFVLAAMAVYIVVDIVKAVKRRKETDI